MRRFRHLTPRYIFYRSKQWWYTRRNPDHPWLTHQAIQLLHGYLQPTHIGLEWGSGRSTLWFAKQVAHLTSVEDDTAWHTKIETALQAQTLNNVTYHFCQKEDAYVEIGAAFEPGTLDFILVDGTHRALCAQVALDKLKSGGRLIIDNVNWYLPSQSKAPHSRTFEQGPATEAWETVWETIQAWPLEWTSNGVWDTAMFTKP